MRYNKDSAAARRRLRRRIRARTRALIRLGRYDALPRYRGTEGWNTW